MPVAMLPLRVLLSLSLMAGLLVACGGEGGGGGVIQRPTRFSSDLDGSDQVRDIEGAAAYCESYETHYVEQLDEDELYDWFCRPLRVQEAILAGDSRSECEDRVLACREDFETPVIGLIGNACGAFAGFHRACDARISELEECLSDWANSLADFVSFADCRLVDGNEDDRAEAIQTLVGGREIPSSCDRLFENRLGQPNECLQSTRGLDLAVTARPRL